MGSSRWKRFSFFERNILSLPDAVTLDIITQADSDVSVNQIGLSVVNGAGIPIASIPSIPSNDGTGVSGMMKTLIRTTENAGNVSNDGNRNTFQFSNSGKTLSLPSNRRSSKGNVDGSLVLAFLSSKISERVHCVDLTVRCNPLHKTHKSVTNNSSSDELDNMKEQDLDGWRGYFSPFSHEPGESIMGSSTSINSSSDTPRFIPKVVNVAVCSDHDTEEIKVGRNIYVACITDAGDSVGVCVHRNPHLYLNDLSSLLKRTNATVSTSLSPQTHERVTPKVECFQPSGIFDQTKYGKPKCVDIRTHIVAVGTDTGIVLIYHYNTSIGGTVNTSTNILTLLMEIYPPHASKGRSDESTRTGSNLNPTDITQHISGVNVTVSAVKLILDSKGGEDFKMVSGSISGLKLFVTYSKNMTHASSQVNSNCGVCCFDLGVLNISSGSNVLSSPSARYDLDGRLVPEPNLCDVIRGKKGTGLLGDKLIVARADGLYTYSTTDKLSVSPIDGSKIALCNIPSAPVSRRYYPLKHLPNQMQEFAGDDKIDDSRKVMGEFSSDTGASYALIATTDSKSGRDAIDIYDISNKLVAFHLLLSPGHRTMNACGVTTFPKTVMDNNIRGGLSSAVVFTSVGSIVTFTEKVTSEKVSLLVQKNLYGAAISMAFSDPSYQASDIAALFRRHAEHLYRKGDYAAAMDQYILTIGSLESSHVIFRYLDAPKLSLLTKYLENLRSRNLASSAHLELLKTCYTKLNESDRAEKISASLSKTMSSSSCNDLISNQLHNPTEALATLCSFDAPQAADSLKTHGTILAKTHPKETGGIVISLCDGIYSPTSLSELGKAGDLDPKRNPIALIGESIEPSSQEVKCDLYPVSDFSSAFLENPKILLVILAHCYKNKRKMDHSHKRMLLELTVEDWNAAKRSGDLDRANIRKESALALLSDSRFISEIGDYEALVIVEEQGFDEGIMLMYEKLQMTQILLEKYAEDGSYIARRKMLAMCRSDPELLADVLGYFIEKANNEVTFGKDDESISSECTIGELLDDIREGLSMARSQNVLPPVRVARILAGDGIGQFPEEKKKGTIIKSHEEKGVPLSVAIEYICDILDDSSKVVDRLRNDVEEYDRLCNSMENEISELLSDESKSSSCNRIGIDIDEMYSKILGSQQVVDYESERKTELVAESFWREINQSSDRFETLARFFAKDVLD